MDSPVDRQEARARGSNGAVHHRVTRPPIRYHGGKFRIASWVISHFPAHECYVEPFGGGAGVLLQKTPAPFEVLNDLDGEVVNFFRVLRERPGELVRVIQLTPWSREEQRLSFEPASDPLERARRFYVRSWQTHGGPGRSGKADGGTTRPTPAIRIPSGIGTRRATCGPWSSG